MELNDEDSKIIFLFGGDHYVSSKAGERGKLVVLLFLVLYIQGTKMLIGFSVVLSSLFVFFSHTVHQLTN